MEATLTELRRDTKRVVAPVYSGEEVVITEHGQPKFKLCKVRPAFHRPQAIKDLIAIGPVEFLPRK